MHSTTCSTIVSWKASPYEGKPVQSCEEDRQVQQVALSYVAPLSAWRLELEGLSSAD